MGAKKNTVDRILGKFVVKLLAKNLIATKAAVFDFKGWGKLCVAHERLRLARSIKILRSIRHWTPRYFYNRIRVFLYEIKHPDCPWLTKQANEILQSWLKKSDIGLEWGSGRSTIWFSRRVAKLISVEHDPMWYSKVKMKLEECNITNTELCYCEVLPGCGEPENNEYVRIADILPDNSLDFVLVDGKFRSECALRVLGKIRPSGLLIIDNVNWFLPSTSSAPNSRTEQDGPSSRRWQLLAELLKGWRVIWTSDGVTDTAIWVKPCSQ